MIENAQISGPDRVEKSMRPSGTKRQDGTSILAEVITSTKMIRGEAMVTREFTLVEPVVGPGGRFIEVKLDAQLKPGERGLKHAEIGTNGLVQLTAHGLRMGFVFYYDICHGTVKGVRESERHWKIWEAVRKMRFEGRVPEHGEDGPALPASKLFHPEVMRRRATVKRGVVHLSAAAMDKEIEGLIKAADDLPEAERERLKEVGNAHKGHS